MQFLRKDNDCASGDYHDEVGDSDGYDVDNQLLYHLFIKVIKLNKNQGTLTFPDLCRFLGTFWHLECPKQYLLFFYLFTMLTRPSFAKDWLDQLLHFPGLVWKRVSTMDVITRGQSSAIFLCIGPFLAWWQISKQTNNQQPSFDQWEGNILRNFPFLVRLSAVIYFVLSATVQCGRFVAEEASIGFFVKTSENY